MQVPAAYRVARFAAAAVERLALPGGGGHLRVATEGLQSDSDSGAEATLFSSHVDGVLIVSHYNRIIF